MRSVRLDSPGPSHIGTTLCDSETGEKLHGVRWVRATVSIDEPTIIEAEFICALTTAEGRLVALVNNPKTGERQEVKSIVFADGSVWEA